MIGEDASEKIGEGIEATAQSIGSLVHKVKPKTAIKKEKLGPALGDKFLGRFFNKPKKITCRTWLVTNNTETAVEEKDVDMGADGFEVGSGKYDIDYMAIQNVFGALVYNTKYKVANGALRFVKHFDKQIDAKTRSYMAQKDNLHAIWKRWQLPFIIALIAMVGAIIGFTLFALEASANATDESCLHNEACMAGKIIQLQKEAQAQADAQAKAKAGGK